MRVNVFVAALIEFDLDGNRTDSWASVQVLVVPVYMVSTLRKRSDSDPPHTVVQSMDLFLHNAFMKRDHCAYVFVLYVGNSWPLASNSICIRIHTRFKHVLCSRTSNELAQGACGSPWAARRPNAVLRVRFPGRRAGIMTASEHASTPGSSSMASRCTHSDTPAHSYTAGDCTRDLSSPSHP
ncbi:hypothetical protein F1559_004090 [Cyanidiococcus yangmingshanensis]|uniref:Uncharacterized protein n=1 Tax=Cyanidiococcus yangmingshanensis TaxID=2690220 RepID=A0A7J7IL63_9RHOD|nr:hypothetical protein F1559_004090 [Cyanidiococcus yangmingshanensis]